MQRDSKPYSMNPGLEALKDAWNDNPILVIGVATGACMAIAKLLDSVSAVQGRRAYARQIKMRTRAN